MTTRKRESMPKAVSEALTKAGQNDAYAARPPYQRNDWLHWIKDAKQDATREKRIAQMISELRAGDTYMGMAWTGGEKA